MACLSAISANNFVCTISVMSLFALLPAETFFLSGEIMAGYGQESSEKEVKMSQQ